MATQNKELARQLLLDKPQLPKALFQVFPLFLVYVQLVFSVVPLIVQCVYYFEIRLVYSYTYILYVYILFSSEKAFPLSHYNELMNSCSYLKRSCLWI